MLEYVDSGERLEKGDYIHRLTPLQVKLRGLGYQLYVQKRTLVVIFEGWDAAGKGGAIKRITERLDPRGYEVFPIAAPAGEDRTHHYLWRFWRRLKPPDEKQVLIFDRSWYGRVLVERIEGFCSEADWKRAYREINSFERQLVDSGALLVKFWMHVTKDEQLRRFEERQADPYKSWKLTSEDWRNREKWERYLEAASEMMLKTSTLFAPWTVVYGNDKYSARIQVVSTLVDALGKDLKPAMEGPEKKVGKKKKGKEKGSKKNG